MPLLLRLQELQRRNDRGRKYVTLHWFSASEDCEGVDKVRFFFFLHPRADTL